MRPRKLNPADAAAAAASAPAVGSQKKKGRGRPRKRKAAAECIDLTLESSSVDDDADDAEDDAVDGADDGAEETAPKEPEAEEAAPAPAAAAVAAVSTPAKRKRGRPSKFEEKLSPETIAAIRRAEAAEAQAGLSSSSSSAASSRSPSPSPPPPKRKSLALSSPASNSQPAAASSSPMDLDSIPLSQLASSSSSSAAAAAAAASSSSSAATAAAAAAAAPSACAHCSCVFTGRGCNLANNRLHEDACAKRTPEERRAHQRTKEKRRLSDKSKTTSDSPERKHHSPSAAVAAASPAAASAPSSSSKRKRASTSTSSPLRSGPVLSSRLLKSVGYDLDGDDAEAVAKKKVYEVEAVRSRRFNKRTLQYEYELKWLGWPEADNTWESAKDTHCRDLIHAFHLRAEEELTLQIDEAFDAAHGDPPAVAFHRDGLCSLIKPELCLSPENVAIAEAKVTKLFNSTLKTLTNCDQLDILESRGFDNFKLRQRGRYDLTLAPEDFPFLADPPWLATVRSILGGSARLQHTGCMMSLPSSATQPWHSDGPHRSKDAHLPAYMLNVFVPLVDVTRQMGGTQFNPGSHVHHDFMIRTTSVTPLLKAGQCLLFDYRIRHRGLANDSARARPVLYFTYSASDSVVDEANFKRGRYAALPPLIVQLEESRAERMKRRKRERGDPSSSEGEEEEEDGDGEGGEGAGQEDDQEEAEENDSDVQVIEETKEPAKKKRATAAPSSSPPSSSAPSTEQKPRRKRGRPSASSSSAAATAAAAASSSPSSSFSAVAAPAASAATTQTRVKSRVSSSPLADLKSSLTSASAAAPAAAAAASSAAAPSDSSDLPPPLVELSSLSALPLSSSSARSSPAPAGPRFFAEHKRSEHKSRKNPHAQQVVAIMGEQLIASPSSSSATQQKSKPAAPAAAAITRSIADLD